MLNKVDYERDFKAAQALEGKARDAAMFQLMPPHQARNHATTAEAPAESDGCAGRRARLTNQSRRSNG